MGDGCPACRDSTDARALLLPTLCPRHRAEHRAPSEQQVRAAIAQGLRDFDAVVSNIVRGAYLRLPSCRLS